MSDISLRDAKHPFFLGIGGIGISAVARMFLLDGKEVYGSDTSASEITEELEKLGARISIGQGIELIPEDADLVVYTVAIQKYAPELLEKLQAREAKLFSYPQVLHEISKNKFTIAVAGTHGKTTTTAMIARILMDAGLDPTVIVGSLLISKKSPKATFGARPSNFVAGKGKYFVVEACEYQRSFLELDPTIGVILNIDDDHLDYYGGIAGVQKGFSEFAAKIKEGGVLVCNPAQPSVAPVAKSAAAQVVDYSKFLQKVPKLRFPGEHVRLDAAAALAVASILNIPEPKAQKPLEDFRGTWRRFEFKGQLSNGALLYDDYAHHPTEIAATIAGVREMFPDKRITVVFQPHLYSRTKEHLEDFGKVLAAVDRIILAPIYAAREKPDSTISSADVAQEIRKKNKNVSVFGTFEEISAELQKSASKENLIITMGAGDIYRVWEVLTN